MHLDLLGENIRAWNSLLPYFPLPDACKMRRRTRIRAQMKYFFPFSSILKIFLMRPCRKQCVNFLDKIYHVWECDDDAQGFLVHSCWVNDGRGQRFDLLDIDGCAVDPIIQADIKYEPSLTRAFVETHGYKFSDTSVLNYQCVLELCKKAQGECDGLTPPNCGRGKRSARSVNTIVVEKTLETDRLTGSETGFDVVTSMDVLDTLEEDVDQNGVPDELMNQLNGRPYYHPRSGLLPSFQTEKMCLSTPAFGIMLAITVILFLTAVITSSFLCFRVRYEKA